MADCKTTITVINILNQIRKYFPTQNLGHIQSVQESSVV